MAKTTTNRKLSMYGFALVENGHNFYALLDFDITNLRENLRQKRQTGAGGSLFAFMLKAIALCLKQNPEFNAMIDYKNTTLFDEVSISIPIEVHKDGKVFNKQFLLKNANLKPLTQITQEIETAKQNQDGQEGFVLSPWLRKLIAFIPRPLVMFLFRTLLANHKRVMELSGSVFVTSVSMFTNVPGYIIPYIGGPKASSFAIGSAQKKPVVRGGSIVIRELLNITAVFNHDIIDGAPAARFINQLRRLIETDYTQLVDGDG